MQYLASRNTLFNLNNFLDKAALQGDLTPGGSDLTLVSARQTINKPVLKCLFCEEEHSVRLKSSR